MDPHLLNLMHLKVLDLSNNRIERVEFLPPMLEELYLTANIVKEIVGPRQEKLLHLGLSHNQVNTDQIRAISKYYPGLFSLNLGYNQIEDCV